MSQLIKSCPKLSQLISREFKGALHALIPWASAFCVKQLKL